MTCFKCEIPTSLLIYYDSRQDVLLWILSHHASYCTSTYKVPLLEFTGDPYRKIASTEANFHIIYFIQLVSQASFKASVEGQIPPGGNSEQELT